MKKHFNIYIILTAVAAIFLFACKKSFLEAEPYSFIETDHFYKTAKDAEAALTGCYNMLNSEEHGRMFGETMLHILNTGNDECVTGTGIVNENTTFGIASTTAADASLKGVWAALYQGVNRCNHLIAKIDPVEMDVVRKEEIKAEAYFLRGFYHMILAQMFGDIPVNIEPDPEFFQPRAPLQEVYTQVLSDFTKAATVLPHRATIAGRANKWSAEGFRAKVFAYLAACKVNGTGTALGSDLNKFDWVNAASMYDSVHAVASRIIASGGFKLTEKYNYLFRENTRQWQYEECLFTVEGTSSATNGVYLRLGNAWLPWGNINTRGGASSKWFVPTAEVYTRYNDADIRRKHNLTGAIPNTNTAPVEIIEGVRYYVPAAAVLSVSNYGIAKYRYRDPASKSIPPFLSDGALTLLRYADILLLDAEARFFKGDESGARALLLPIRQRAVFGTTTNVSVLTTAYFKPDFMEELLAERSRELCFELGIRRFDLIRFAKHTTAIQALKLTGSYHNEHSVAQLKTNWQPYKIWFPVPSAEIDLNQSLKQNPGF